MNKRDLRRIFLKKRDLLSEQEVKTASLRIMEELYKDPDFINSKSVMAYIPIRNEVNPLIDMSIYEGKTLSVPKISDDKLIPCLYQDPFVKSHYDILEPKDCKKMEIDLCLVPGVCFDRYLYRVGFGKGFYDRFLSEHKEVFSIGICYDFQLVDEIEKDPFDVKLNKIISENYLIEGGNQWKF
jgi:5-formyltetrahydrofolate cyclo-ligase